jgi:hypothetical protein
MNTNTTPQADLNSNLQKLDTFLTKYLIAKAPPLPVKAKEFIVKWGPYLDLLLLILTAPVILAAVGFSFIALPLSALTGSTSITGIIQTLIFIVIIIMELIALPGLFKRSKSAWTLLYYSALLSALNSLISLNLVGGLISTALTLYILYQIREYYH